MLGGAVFHMRSISAGVGAQTWLTRSLRVRSSLKVLAARAREGWIAQVYSSRNAWTPAAVTGRVLPSRLRFSSPEALARMNGVPQKHDILTNRPLFDPFSILQFASSQNQTVRGEGLEIRRVNGRQFRAASNGHRRNHAVG